MTQSVSEQLSQLGDARQLVLADAALYPQIIAGVLPIIGVNALLDLRRWGADFLAETFASVAVTSLQKRQMSIVVLQTMRELLEKQDQDPAVVKDIVQAAAGLYGHVFHHVYVRSLFWYLACCGAATWRHARCFCGDDGEVRL